MYFHLSPIDYSYLLMCNNDDGDIASWDFDLTLIIYCVVLFNPLSFLCTMHLFTVLQYCDEVLCYFVTIFSKLCIWSGIAVLQRSKLLFINFFWYFTECCTCIWLNVCGNIWQMMQYVLFVQTLWLCLEASHVYFLIIPLAFNKLATNCDWPIGLSLHPSTAFYAPGLKGPLGAFSNRIVRLSVNPSVCNSVRLTKCKKRSRIQSLSKILCY